MFELKSISSEGLPNALEKAERLRLVNEPEESESICRDILRADPGKQDVLVVLLLALTDQFARNKLARAFPLALEVLENLQDPYSRAYYEGVVYERRAKAHLAENFPGNASAAFDWLRQAMECYEKAEGLRPQGNDEAILRWNTCVRAIRDQKLQPAGTEPAESQLE